MTTVYVVGEQHCVRDDALFKEVKVVDVVWKEVDYFLKNTRAILVNAYWSEGWAYKIEEPVYLLWW